MHTLELHVLSAKFFHTVASLKNADLNKNIQLLNPALKIKQNMQKNIDIKVVDVCIFHTDNMLTIAAHNRAFKKNNKLLEIALIKWPSRWQFTKNKQTKTAKQICWYLMLLGIMVSSISSILDIH